MANAKIIEQKKAVVKEIKDKFDNAKTVVLFDARGLKVSEVNELRKVILELSKNKGSFSKLDETLFLYRKEENKSMQLNKKLAENNPIALIRSQKNRRPTDA